MKIKDYSIREYISRLSKDDFVYIYRRLRDKYVNDLPEALNVLSGNKDMDDWLRTNTHEDFYDKLDHLFNLLANESYKRFTSEEAKSL